jgi:hypothetical protein
MNFHDRFSKNTEISNFMKILPVGAKLFHVDGQTDMTKIIVTFRNFANVPSKHKIKSWNQYTYCVLSMVKLPVFGLFSSVSGLSGLQRISSWFQGM